LIQLATNLHNDYADFVKGADDERRVGQARATAKGWLSPAETAGGATVCLVAAAAVGMELVRFSSASMSMSTAGGGEEGEEPPAFDVFFAIVVATSCFNAVAYTGGPYPLGYVGLGWVSIGYSGLGDLFVFLYFGLVATLGVPYMCLRACGDSRVWTEMLLSPSSSPPPSGGGPGGTGGTGIVGEAGLLEAFLTALPVSSLATAIIVVNNLRDRNTDVAAGKRTLAVRFGEKFARAEYATLVLSSYAFQVYAAAFGGASHGPDGRRWWGLLPLLSLPVAVPQLRAVAFGGKDGAELNEHVGGTARLQLLYSMLLTAGVMMSW